MLTGFIRGVTYYFLSLFAKSKAIIVLTKLSSSLSPFSFPQSWAIYKNFSASVTFFFGTVCFLIDELRQAESARRLLPVLKGVIKFIFAILESTWLSTLWWWCAVIGLVSLNGEPFDFSLRFLGDESTVNRFGYPSRSVWPIFFFKLASSAFSATAPPSVALSLFFEILSSILLVYLISSFSS